MLRIFTLVLLTSALLMSAGPAIAYIGPGAGISVLGSLLGILATIVVAIGAILFWPLRKFMKRRKTRREFSEDVKASGLPDDVAGDHSARDDP